MYYSTEQNARGRERERWYVGCTYSTVKAIYHIKTTDNTLSSNKIKRKHFLFKDATIF
jgi:hypothetical protein